MLILCGKYVPTALVMIGASTALCLRLRRHQAVEAGWIRYGLLRTGFSALGLLAGSVDKLLIGLFVSLPALAAVSYAEGLYGLLQAVYKALETAYSSRIGSTKDRTALVKTLRRHAALLSLPLGLGAVLAYLALPWAVRCLLPPGYEGVVRLGRVYVVAWGASLPTLLLSPVIWMYHLSRADAKLTVRMHAIRLVSLGTLLPVANVMALPLARGIANLANAIMLHREIGRFEKAEPVGGAMHEAH